MTNCGALGWTTDRSGYRYDCNDPQSGKPWPAMPPAFDELATQAAERAGFPGFSPDACLINRYEPGARMSLHQDRDEHDFGAPIVSVSLGLPAIFLFGGLKRSDRPRRFRLEHADVVVWGGPARLVCWAPPRFLPPRLPAVSTRRSSRCESIEPGISRFRVRRSRDAPE